MRAKREIPNTIWTGPRMATLSRLWDEGLSCTVIASIMGDGITRNAVIGKVHRMGLHLRRATYRPRPYRRVPPRTRKEASMDRESQHRVRRAPEFKSVPLPKSAVWKPLPGSAPIGLLDINDKTCRWPIGDDRPFRFCGCATVSGSSYCKDHAATSTAFRPVVPANNTRVILGSDTSKKPLAALGETARGGRVETQELSTV